MPGPPLCGGPVVQGRRAMSVPALDGLVNPRQDQHQAAPVSGSTLFPGRNNQRLRQKDGPETLDIAAFFMPGMIRQWIHGQWEICASSDLRNSCTGQTGSGYVSHPGISVTREFAFPHPDRVGRYFFCALILHFFLNLLLTKLLKELKYAVSMKLREVDALIDVAWANVLDIQPIFIFCGDGQRGGRLCSQHRTTGPLGWRLSFGRYKGECIRMKKILALVLALVLVSMSVVALAEAKSPVPPKPVVTPVLVNVNVQWIDRGNNNVLKEQKITLEANKAAVTISAGTIAGYYLAAGYPDAYKLTMAENKLITNTDKNGKSALIKREDIKFYFDKLGDYTPPTETTGDEDDGDKGGEGAPTVELIDDPECIKELLKELDEEKKPLDEAFDLELSENAKLAEVVSVKLTVSEDHDPDKGIPLMIKPTISLEGIDAADLHVLMAIIATEDMPLEDVVWKELTPVEIVEDEDGELCLQVMISADEFEKIAEAYATVFAVIVDSEEAAD